jgi:hypothetical protein
LAAFFPNSALTTSPGKTGRSSDQCVRVRQGSATIRDESSELPAKRILALAVLGDSLYLSVVHKEELKAGYGAGSGITGGALCRLKPESGRVVTVASSRSMQRRNPLDGEFLFSIKSMLSDPQRACIWLAVATDDGRYYDRVGLWKFVPADGSIKQIYRSRSYSVSGLRWSEGSLLVRTGTGIRRFDPNTGNAESLTGRKNKLYGNYLMGIGSYAILDGSLLAMASGRLNLLEPGRPPAVVRTLPDGTAFPAVQGIRQVDDQTVLLQPKHQGHIPTGQLWLLECQTQTLEAATGE